MTVLHRWNLPLGGCLVIELSQAIGTQTVHRENRIADKIRAATDRRSCVKILVRLEHTW